MTVCLLAGKTSNCWESYVTRINRENDWDSIKGNGDIPLPIYPDTYMFMDTHLNFSKTCLNYHKVIIAKIQVYSH